MVNYYYRACTTPWCWLMIIFTQDFKHWTMKIRLLCWKVLQLKQCSSVQLRFSIRNFQLDMLTYWKREFERVVSDLVNGKKKRLFLQVRVCTAMKSGLLPISCNVLCPLWLAWRMALKRYVNSMGLLEAWFKNPYCNSKIPKILFTAVRWRTTRENF